MYMYIKHYVHKNFVNSSSSYILYKQCSSLEILSSRMVYFNARYLKCFPNTDIRLFNANMNTLLTIRFSLLIILQINFRSLFSNIIFNGKQLVITGNKFQ